MRLTRLIRKEKGLAEGKDPVAVLSLQSFPEILRNANIDVVGFEPDFTDSSGSCFGHRRVSLNRRQQRDGVTEASYQEISKPVISPMRYGAGTPFPVPEDAAIGFEPMVIMILPHE